MQQSVDFEIKQNDVDNILQHQITTFGNKKLAEITKFFFAEIRKNRHFTKPPSSEFTR